MAALDLVSPIGMLRKTVSGGITARPLPKKKGSLAESQATLFDVPAPLPAQQSVPDDPQIFFHGTAAPRPFESKEGFLPSFEARMNDEGELVDLGSGIDPTAFLGAHFSDQSSVGDAFAEGVGRASFRSDTRRAGFLDTPDLRPRVIMAKLDADKPKKFKNDLELSTWMMKSNVKNKVDSVLDDYGVGLEEVVAAVDKKTKKPLSEEAMNRLYANDPDFRRQVNIDVVDMINERGVGEYEHLEAQEFMDAIGAASREELKRLGHDSVIYENMVEGGHAAVIWDNDKILSAFGKSTRPLP